MRRFSQRSALVTLSEINITPLLDLAFVLLIIFVITTPLLEQGLPVTLPSGGDRDRRIERENTRTIEIDAAGRCMLDKTQLSPDQIEITLAQVFQANPDLVVYIRADKAVPFEWVFNMTDRLQRHGIRRVSFRSTPTDPRR